MEDTWELGAVSARRVPSLLIVCQLPTTPAPTAEPTLVQTNTPTRAPTYSMVSQIAVLKRQVSLESESARNSAIRRNVNLEHGSGTTAPVLTKLAAVSPLLVCAALVLYANSKQALPR